MSLATMALLADRAVVRVAGADAETLLQGVITNDMSLLAKQPAMHAALLTPQGKILFEFFVVKDGEASFLLETGRDKAADLAKRLAMYKLRAKATIGDSAQEFAILARWDGAHASAPGDPPSMTFLDPRHPALGSRALIPLAPGQAAASLDGSESAEAYHAHRTALGIPEGGKDYALGDTFPHEADLDLLHGVSFTKGCFVGQEVVSRMQNRANVRKRVVPVEGDAPLAPGADISAGAVVIGKVGSVAGTRALAMLRLDRAAEAAAKGEALMAGDVRITVRNPDWAKFDIAPAAAEAP